MRERALAIAGRVFLLPAGAWALGLGLGVGAGAVRGAVGGGIAGQPLLSALCLDWNEGKRGAKGSQRRT